MTAVYKYSRDVNTKEAKELLKQKAELAREQMAINWSLINVGRNQKMFFSHLSSAALKEASSSRGGSEAGLSLDNSWPVSGRDGTS